MNDPKRARSAFHLPAVVAFAASILSAWTACAADADSNSAAAELAEKLSNPVADLMSFPFQSNWDFKGGPNGDGQQYKLNIQPVIPIELSDTWNLISRTIVPLVDQSKFVNDGSQSGLGDIVQSVFFSPKAATSSGWIWGAGPVFLLPTAADTLLGSQKWGIGPTAVALKQQGGWTMGFLANHIWSFAGNSNRQDVNATFLQPFIAYTTKRQTTVTLNSESTYDWTNKQWTVPVNVMVAQLVRLGSMPVQFQGGVRYYMDKPASGPDWGVRFNVVLLLPAS